MKNIFTLLDFQEKMTMLNNELSRGKSINSMSVRAIVLWLVQFQQSEEYDLLTEAIRIVQEHQYENPKGTKK